VRRLRANEPAELLTALLGRLKALYWHHWTAHWQTSGEQFYGDHQLFERLKNQVEEEIDPLAEILVGYYGEDAVDPQHVMEHEHEGMDVEPGDLVSQALQRESEFQALLNSTIDRLEQMEALTPALDDFLPAMSRTHDSHLYLLGQRSKAASTDAFSEWSRGLPRGAYFNSLERGWMGQSTFDPIRHAEEEDEEVEVGRQHGAWDEWIDAGLLMED